MRFRLSAASPGLLLVMAVGLTASACLPIAFHAMFSGFRVYDDEGYLLLSLRQYARGAALYEVPYLQYGPAYFQFTSAVFEVLGLPFTHTAGRAIVLGFWLATSAVCGVATHRLTGSLPVSLASQLLVFHVLAPLRNEPIHPGGPVSLFLSLVVLAGTCLGRGAGRAVPAAIGGLLAAITLMKVNIGLLAGVSTGFAEASAGRVSSRPPLATLAAGAVMVLVPVAIIGPLAALPGTGIFLAVVVGSVLAVVSVQLASSPRSPRPGRDLAVLGLAFAAAGAISAGWELLRGTGLTALLRGVLVDPARYLTVTLFLPMAPAMAAWTLGWLGLALAFGGACRRGWMVSDGAGLARGLAQVAGGVFIWLVLTDQLPFDPVSAPLPLLWLALAGGADGDAGRERGRALLVALSVLQVLHAFPVAGSQVAFATFLFVPVAGVALADGWRTAGRAVGSLLGVPAARPLLASALLATVVLPLAARPVYELGQLARAAYDGGVPLGLPGAEPIRVPVRQAALYRLLAERVSGQCRSLVTLPGLGSLYLFTRLDPPPMMYATSWLTTLSPAQQGQIAERWARLPEPACAVRWSVPAYPDVVLTRFFDEHFATVFRVEDHHFMVRRDRARAGAPGQGA